MILIYRAANGLVKAKDKQLQAVISLFDAEHQHKVEQLWAELADRFGIRGVYITPFPHFSYHVAKKYHNNKLAEVLENFAAQTPSFKIHTSGLGIFTAAQPIIYIPIVRSPALTQLHAALWPLLDKVASKVIDYYAPHHWLPHITLGQTDITPANLGPIVTWLNQQQLTWQIEITSLGTIYAKGAQQFLGPQYTLAVKLCCFIHQNVL